MPDLSYRFIYKGKQLLFSAFDGGASLGENLAAVMPGLIARGIIAPDRGISSFTVSHNGQTLNQHLRISEQCHPIPENEMLELADAELVVQVRFVYNPDHLEARSQSQKIDVLEPVGPQLSKLWGEISTNHRFRGRKRSRFSLRLDGRKLSLDKPLNAQGIDSDVELSVVPVAWPGWPLWWWEKILVSVFVCALVGLALYWFWPRNDDATYTSYRVFVNTDVPCRLEFSRPDQVYDCCLDNAGDAPLFSLPSADYFYTVVPRGFPIYSDTLRVGPCWAVEDSLVVSLQIQDRYSSTPRLKKVKIAGYFDHGGVDSRIAEDLLINGFPEKVPVFGDPGWVSMNLYPAGVYRIEFDLKRELFRRQDFDLPYTCVYQVRDFTFDFGEVVNEESCRDRDLRMIFYYDWPQVEGQ